MLQLVDETLEAFLRAEVPLPERDVDIAFEAPDSEWGARITRPTVNLYLWDLRRDVEFDAFGLERRTGRDQNEVWSPALPRMNLRFLVTAWASDIRDEHALLGAVLRALLLAPTVDEAYLTGELVDTQAPMTLVAARPDRKDSADIWSALGGQLKPGLDLLVAITLPDSAPSWQVMPEPSEISFGMDSTGGPGTGGPDSWSWGQAKGADGEADGDSASADGSEAAVEAGAGTAPAGSAS